MRFAGDTQNSARPDDHDKRISGLEKFNAKVIGITIGISAVASVIGATVTNFLYDFWSTLITP